MHKYEFLILSTPSITGEEMNSLEKKFEDLLKQFKGSLVSFDKWGKCRLAYPVKHHEYGVYYLARFEIQEAQEFFKEIKLLIDVKYTDLVLRTLSVRIADNKNFTNFRPATVEDTPTRNVDQFLKENKMEGLVKNSSHDDEDESYDADEEAVA